MIFITLLSEIKKKEDLARITLASFFRFSMRKLPGHSA